MEHKNLLNNSKIILPISKSIILNVYLQSTNTLLLSQKILEKKGELMGFLAELGGKEEEGIRVNFHLLQSEKQNNLVNAQIR